MKQRHAWILSNLGGTIPEAAARLGMSPGALQVALHRMRKAGVPVPAYPRGPTPKPVPQGFREAWAVLEGVPEVAAALGVDVAEVLRVARRLRARGEKLRRIREFCVQK